MPPTDSTLSLLLTITFLVLTVLALKHLRRYLIFRSMDNRCLDDAEMHAAKEILATQIPASGELKKAMLYGAAVAVVAWLKFYL